MGKTKWESLPLWNSEQNCSQHEGAEWCESDCVPAKEECLHPEHLHTGVGTFSGAKATPESVMYYNNSKYDVDIPDQMRGSPPSKVER